MREWIGYGCCLAGGLLGLACIGPLGWGWAMVAVALFLFGVWLVRLARRRKNEGVDLGDLLDGIDLIDDID